MPTPESQPVLFSDEDVIMEGDEDWYGCETTWDEQQSYEADETWANTLDSRYTGEEIEDYFPNDEYSELPASDQDSDDDSEEFRGPALDGPNAAWSEDTVQTEEMSRLGICVNTCARVIVCLTCAYVVKPLELPAHFAKLHPPMSITPAFCQELAETYNLEEDPVRLRPGRIITAIYGLNIVRDYLSCDSCGYACRTEKRIKIHTGTSEGCDSYQRRHAQTFRSTSKRMYFGVTLESTMEAIEDPLDPVAYLKTKFALLPFSQTPDNVSGASRRKPFP